MNTNKKSRGIVVSHNSEYPFGQTFDVVEYLLPESIVIRADGHNKNSTLLTSDVKISWVEGENL
jgi:hypothetical protein